MTEILRRDNSLHQTPEGRDALALHQVHVAQAALPVLRKRQRPDILPGAFAFLRDVPGQETHQVGIVADLPGPRRYSVPGTTAP